MEGYFSFSVNANYLWTNFESDLKTFDWKAFFEDHNQLDLNSESFQPNEVSGLEDELDEEINQFNGTLREAFTSWIEIIEYLGSFSSATHGFNLDPLNQYITFNYTNMLEEMYNIPQSNILYIHNKLNSYEGELIFGHEAKKAKEPKLPFFDKSGEPTRTIFTDSEDIARSLFYEFQKDTEMVIKNIRQESNQWQMRKKSLCLYA